MRRLAVHLFLLTIFILSLATVPSPQAMAQEPNLFHQTIFSAQMGNRNWGYNVYLPPSYDASSKRYPVVYVLHGGGGDEHGMTFITRNYVHNWIKNGQIPEVIMVFPNGGRDHFFLDRWVVRNQNENPDSHIIRELIPHIDSTFRTIPDRSGRAITGFSMGGYGTYHFATKYPEIFSAAAPMAAGGPYGPNGLIVNYSNAEKPQALAVSQANNLRDRTSFYVAVGGRDLVDYNNQMVGILRGQNIATEYFVLPNVGHDLGAIMNQVGLQLFQGVTAKFPRDYQADDEQATE
jgi:endo-1,4-beta-xylanase